MRLFTTHKLFNVLVLCIIMLILIAWCFGPMMVHPNDYYFASGGDGIRNYYSVAYYVKYDHGIHFTGMNYPYGDHVMYCDNQFPVAFLLRFINHTFFDVGDSAVAIINYILLFSFLLSALFIFLILEKFQVSAWFSIPASIAITFLSPQVQRLSGQYSLAYLFFIPMFIYLIIRFLESQKKIKWAAIFTIVLLFFSLVHLYYLALSLSFIISFAFFLLIYELIKGRRFLKNAVFLIIPGILSAVIVGAFLFFTDPITDRIKIPWGFFESYATDESIFKPPAWSYLKMLGLHGMISKTQQGYAYIGLVADLAILLYVIGILLAIIKKKIVAKIFPPIPSFLMVAVWASVPVLLFSMCLPWRWGLEHYSEHFPFIRQFRALDRFAYVFYYVISIFAAYLFFSLIRTLIRSNKKMLAALTSLLIFILWFFDSLYNIKTITDSYQYNNYAREYFSDDNYLQWLRERGYTPADFQAVIALPFFHIGSEKIWIDNAVSIYASTWASLNTGLPIAGSYLGRTSLSETINLVQLTADSLIEKQLLSELKNDKPFLLVTTQESLTDYEKMLISKSVFICKKGGYSIYKLPLSAFAASYARAREIFNHRNDSLIFHPGGFYTSKSEEAIVMKNYSLQGSFLQGVQKSDSGRMHLFNGKVPQARDSMRFEVSVWIKLSTENYATPDLHFFEFDSSGRQMNFQYAQAKSSRNLYQGWDRVSLTLLLTNKNDRIEILLTGDDHIEAEHFLIRPVDTDVYYSLQDDGSFVLNNFFITPPGNI